MINDLMWKYGVEPSAIRELFAYGMQRKAVIGAENVFDFSIGAPSVPVPQEVHDAIIDLIQNTPSQALHGYTPTQGDPSVLQSVAEHLNKRFGANASAAHIYMVAGAAAGLSISVKSLTDPGDEVIVLSPYFPEYAVYCANAGVKCVEVPTLEPSFTPDVEAIRAAITPKTCIVIINTPNNPTGAVYSREVLEQLCNMLREKEAEVGHPIYLLSDEPYRELVYDNAEVTWLPSIYNDTLVVYSWSKSLSLPGERVGYIYINERCKDWQAIADAVHGCGRVMGYACSGAMYQKVIERCLDIQPDISTYEENRRIMTEGLAKLGYEFVHPQGAFYLWVKALEPDAEAFSAKAKEHELLLVPSNSFGASGWVRLGFCVDKEVIERSMPAFAALKQDYE